MGRTVKQMKTLSFYCKELLPYPGTSRPSTFMRSAELISPDKKEKQAYDLNLCAWLSMDMSKQESSEELLKNLEALRRNELFKHEWHGVGWDVNFTSLYAQFNQNNLGVEDIDWLDQPTGRYPLAEVILALRGWNEFLKHRASSDIKLDVVIGS